jgi:signal transduction histidine kinase
VKPLTGPTPLKSNISSLRRLRLATILLVASFVVLVIGAGVYNLAQQYSVVVNTTTRSARNTVRAIESHATKTFGETFRIIEGIADIYRHELEHQRAGQIGVIDEIHLHNLIADKLKLAPAVMSFFIADEKFKGVAGSRTYPVDMSRVLSTGLSFDNLIDIGDDLFVGQLYKDVNPTAPPDIWMLPVGVRVRDAAGRTRGYVFAIMVTHFFTNYYSTLDVGAHGRIAMWTDDGRLVAGTPNEATSPGAFREMPVKVSSGPEDLTGNVVYTTGATLVNEIVARGNMGNMPLNVSVVLDGQDFLMSWRNTRNAVTLAIISIILAMTVFAFIILRQLRRTEENERALRQAKAAAEEANDAKSRFLAHMSHEFRTPLNAIMGFSEIIKNKVLGDIIAPAYTSYADHIHRSGEHLLNIVNDILDMAKIESGVQPIHQEAIDIPGVITAAVSFVEGLASQKKIRIRVAVQTALPAVSGDQRFSRQVVINLLSNAIKFSPSNSEIIVATQYLEGKYLDVSVSDHGPGIEPALLRRLGEPFLQGNPSVSHSGQGTGLGLSICKRYMDLLGGELLIDSTVGSGTTAIIRFPNRLMIFAKPEHAPSRSVA